MKTQNLKQLRNLRTQEKSIKSSIDSVKPLAIEEAKELCPEGGKITIKDVGEFILDKVPVYDLKDFRKYKDQSAQDWRKALKAREQFMAKVKQQTAIMSSSLKAFKLLTTQEPESYEYNLKCVE